MIARYNVSRLDHQVEPPLPTPEEPCGNPPRTRFSKPAIPSPRKPPMGSAAKPPRRTVHHCATAPSKRMISMITKTFAQ